MRFEVVGLGLARVWRCAEKLIGSLVALEGLLGIDISGQLRFSPATKQTNVNKKQQKIPSRGG